MAADVPVVSLEYAWVTSKKSACVEMRALWIPHAHQGLMTKIPLVQRRS